MLVAMPPTDLPLPRYISIDVGTHHLNNIKNILDLTLIFYLFCTLREAMIGYTFTNNLVKETILIYLVIMSN